MRHRQGDSYMLQVYLEGIWVDVHKVTKNGAALICRTSAKKSGNSHRVINLTDHGSIYVESDPK